MYKTYITYKCNSSVSINKLAEVMPVESVTTNRDGIFFDAFFTSDSFETAKEEVDLQIKNNTTEVIPVSYSINILDKEDYNVRATLDIEVLPTWITPINDGERRRSFDNIKKNLYDYGFTIESYKVETTPGFNNLVAIKNYTDVDEAVKEHNQLLRLVPCISGSIDIAPLARMNGETQ